MMSLGLVGMDSRASRAILSFGSLKIIKCFPVDAKSSIAAVSAHGLSQNISSFFDVGA